MSTDRKTDYFTTLEVTETSSPEEIKQAYRRLARLYHPDLNDDPQAVEQFREITEAYRALSDPEIRAKYIMERMEMRRAIPKQKVNVWNHKYQQRRQNLIFINLGLMLFSCIFLSYSLDRLWLHMYLAYNAESTTCLVDHWEELSQERYRLYYLAIVPWQIEPLQSWRDFDTLQRDLPLGTVFDCYYNEEYRATQLKRIEWNELPSMMPALFAGALLGSYSLYALFQVFNR